MRLQDAKALGSTLRDNGVIIDLVATDFYADICDLINVAEAVQNDNEMHALDQKLRRLCKKYFKQISLWIGQERAKHADVKIYAETRQIESQTREAAQEFEKQFIRHVLCFMHLNRSQFLARRELKSIVDTFEPEKVTTHLEVDGTTGILIKRAYREKRKLLEKRARMIRMQAALTELKEKISTFRPALSAALGHHAGDTGYRDLCKALREGDFKRAEATVKRWGNRRRPIGAGRRYRRSMMTIQKQGMEIIDLVRSNKDDLSVHRGYIIDLSESKMLFSFLMADEQRVDKFLAKYNVRYMVHRYKHLIQLGHRLIDMSTISGLLILHARLVSALAIPITGKEKLDYFREHTLNRLEDLHTKELPELPHVFNDMENTLEELRYMFTQTWAIQDQSHALS